MGKEVPAPVTDPTTLPYLLTVQEDAGLLRTSVEGVYARVERGQLVDSGVVLHSQATVM